MKVTVVIHKPFLFLKVIVLLRNSLAPNSYPPRTGFEKENIHWEKKNSKYSISAVDANFAMPTSTQSGTESRWKRFRNPDSVDHKGHTSSKCGLFGRVPWAASIVALETIFWTPLALCIFIILEFSEIFIWKFHENFNGFSNFQGVFFRTLSENFL